MRAPLFKTLEITSGGLLKQIYRFDDHENEACRIIWYLKTINRDAFKINNTNHCENVPTYFIICADDRIGHVLAITTQRIILQRSKSASVLQVWAKKCLIHILQMRQMNKLLYVSKDLNNFYTTYPEDILLEIKEYI
jgi:hypothetical protein